MNVTEVRDQPVAETETPRAEQWLPVVGYENRYEVSDRGRVRSLRRTVRHKRVDSVLTPYLTAGYPSVGLYTGERSANGRWHRRTHYVHDLMLRAFIGPPPDADMECCHADDNGLNNDLRNLRWGTSLDNSADMRKRGGHGNTKKVRCKRGHLFAGPNLKPGAKPQYRQCRSCTQSYFANRAAKKEGRGFDWELYADEIYRSLMGEEPERVAARLAH